MELLKEFGYEKIKILIDDKNNTRDFNIVDLNDNQTYTIEDIIDTKIEVKDWRIEPCSWNKNTHDLFLYSVNGNEFKINLFDFKFEVTAKKVESTLKELFDEFVVNSGILYIGEKMSINEKKQTVRDPDEYTYFKKKLNGKFYFKSGSREDEHSAEDFETAVVTYLNEKADTHRHYIRMGEMHGDRPEPCKRNSLRLERENREARLLQRRG